MTGVFYGSAGLKHPNYTEVTTNQCHFTRPQWDQEFSIPGVPGRDFAKSRGPGIFQDRISLKFESKEFYPNSMRSLRISFSAHKFGHFHIFWRTLD